MEEKDPTEMDTYLWQHQGKRKDQVDYSSMMVAFCLIASLITILVALVIDAIDFCKLLTN